MEEKINAPFTPEQVLALQDWQACEWVHEFTCCDLPMRVEPRGFVCPKCATVQPWAMAIMAGGPPPYPFKR